jgi:hypothetical protein
MPPRSIRRPRSLLALAQWIAEHTGASVGYFGEAANNVGAQLVGAMPGAGGLNAGQMLTQACRRCCCCTSSPSWTRPTRRLRVPRCSAAVWWSR